MLVDEKLKILARIKKFRAIALIYIDREKQTDRGGTMVIEVADGWINTSNLRLPDR